MFEYTALVDAPVKRFTSIVTDPDPDEPPIVVVAGTPMAPVPMPVAEAPVLLAAVAPDVGGAAAPAQLTVPERHPSAARHDPPAPSRVPAPSPSPTSAAGPSLVPALFGLAAAGITAFWWLRRDAHDRGR